MLTQRCGRVRRIVIASVIYEAADEVVGEINMKIRGGKFDSAKACLRALAQRCDGRSCNVVLKSMSGSVETAGA